MDDEQVSRALLKILKLGLGEPTDFSLESEIEDGGVDVESLSDGLDEPATDSFLDHFQDGVEERINSTYGLAYEKMDTMESYALVSAGHYQN